MLTLSTHQSRRHTLTHTYTRARVQYGRNPQNILTSKHVYADNYALLWTDIYINADECFDQVLNTWRQTNSNISSMGISLRQTVCRHQFDTLKLSHRRIYSVCQATTDETYARHYRKMNLLAHKCSIISAVIRKTNKQCNVHNSAL